MIAGDIQPQILKSRFAKGDDDGFLDRHWVSVTTRKKTYFRDIGDVAPDELDLSRLFYEVHTRHNHAQVNKFMQV